MARPCRARPASSWNTGPPGRPGTMSKYSPRNQNGGNQRSNGLWLSTSGRMPAQASGVRNSSTIKPPIRAICTQGETRRNPRPVSRLKSTPCTLAMLRATKVPAPRTVAAWTAISLPITGAGVPSPPVTRGARLAVEDGAAAERQRGEDQVILAVRKQRVPLEHHDEAHHHHGEHDKEVVVAEQHPVVGERMVEAGALRNHVERHHHAGGRHQSEGLHDVGAHVAMLRDELVIEEAPEEMAYQQWQTVHHPSRITETISRADAPTSSCLASWRKICSSDGKCMRSRRRPTSSLATILPWYSMMTREQTFSVTSSTCEM